MDAFRRFSLFTNARDATFVALATAVVMLAFSFDLALAFRIGASIQLLFALGLLLRFARLSDERIVRTETWRILTPSERPIGEPGRRGARANLELVLLQFAKAAASVAIFLFGSALVVSLNQQAQVLHADTGLPFG